MKLPNLMKKEVVVVLATAPAGLGHLRVTDALYEGLPEEVEPILLGSKGKFIQAAHRITSVSPALRRVMEWVQQGRPQGVFTRFYRKQLHSRDRELSHQLSDIVDQRIEVVKVMLMVATHFGLAHQLGPIKEQLEKEKGIKLVLVVVVTDDSPQYIWYVGEADMIAVPSMWTKKELVAYAKGQHLPNVPVVVNSYPVSGKLARELSRVERNERRRQLDAEGRVQIHVMMPVSGAAVGLEYYDNLAKDMNQLSGRFVFHVVSRESAHTRLFLERMKRRDYARVYASEKDRVVVDLYQEVMLGQTMAMEVTKPSEQAFKGLYSTRQAGGVVLLLSKPVGRQEYDNVNFLRRHGLLASLEEEQEMMAKFGAEQSLGEEDDLRVKARGWRGVMVPEDAQRAAKYVWWLMQQELMAAMGKCEARPERVDKHKDELGSDGVGRFWEKVDGLIGEMMD